MIEIWIRHFHGCWQCQHTTGCPVGFMLSHAVTDISLIRAKATEVQVVTR